MANKKSNVKKPKKGGKGPSRKGGAADFEIGSPKPVRKPKKKR
jgi:hypothetical protein